MLVQYVILRGVDMSNLKSLTKNFSLLLQFKRHSSKLTNQEVLKHRAALFEQEQKRQLSEIVRIEKIEVKHVGPPDQCTLVMNKNISTPYNCAMHVSELLCNRSALALVNGQPWDMHRPLEGDCEIKFLHFKDQDPHHCNKAYWRSCSFFLGYLFETAFKDNFFVDLYSFPPPNIKSGSFIYDFQLNIPDWNPSKEELRCLSMSAVKMRNQNQKFERLIVKPDLAKEIFKYNKFKLEQIPSIAEKTENRISLYKLGDFVDISKGPMISNTSIIGRFEITGIFNIKSTRGDPIQRVQGVSIPSELNLHYWTFSQLAQRASKLNSYDFNFQQKSTPKEVTSEKAEAKAQV